MVRRPVLLAAVALAAAAAAAAPVASALVAGPPAKERPKFAQLFGASEVPGPGDPDGRGSATIIIPGSTKLCYAILVTGIAKPSAAHIHQGGPRVAGDIVVPLSPPPKGTAGAVSGCVTASAAVLSDIAARPGRYYVNVHNAKYPGGALRGQLFLR